MVALADWNPGQASRALGSMPADLRQQAVPAALTELSAVLSGHLWRTRELARRLPLAIEAVKRDLNRR